MKFLFFTDTHIRGTNPRNRTDNFYETLKGKFLEVKQICDEMEVDYVLHGGDWFDRPDISPSIVREFAMILKGYERPIYTIAGNHDVFGHNPETIGRTMLGILEGTGIVKLIGYKDTVILDDGNTRVQLTGKSYKYDIDGENYKEYYCVKKQSDVDYAINLVHGMLLMKPFFEGIQYTLVDDIKDTEADITLVGHYHSGFGIVEKNNKFFINPGSMVRISNSIGEIKRMPAVVFIEVADTINIKEINLKTARPGNEVLDREQMVQAQDRNIKLHQFYQGIEAAANFDRIDLNKIIEEIASNQEIGTEVKDEAIRRLSLARESLASGDEE